MSPQTRKTDNFLPPRSSYTNKYETISIWKQKVLFLHRLLPDNFLVFLCPHSWIWPYLTFTVVQLNSWVDKKIGWQTNVFSFLYINAFFSSETRKIMLLIIYFKNGMNTVCAIQFATKGIRYFGSLNTSRDNSNMLTTFSGHHSKVPDHLI